MAADLARLLRPRSIALLGGVWAENVALQLTRAGYDGAIWPVHPTRPALAGLPCRRSLADLPGAPDAAFVGVNRAAAVQAVAALSAMGAGGATCFAAGFAEAGGAALQADLVAAAGAMPLLGPNCYGILNYLDNVPLWPDQHGGRAVDRGVAVIAQSSNVAINLTMQARGLPIAYVVTAGNQAQTGVAAIAQALAADPRVTAIGLYLEGFGDLAALQDFAARCRLPVVVLKTGRSPAAQAAGLTHTASLAGGAAAASALIARLGWIETRSLTVFLETLKLLHVLGGPLPGASVCSVSCSGGEASLMADSALGTAIDWRPFTPATTAALADTLGPLVTVSNPFDYHTFIWGDLPRMVQVFTAVAGDGFDLTVFVLDLPRADRCDPSGFRAAVDAIIAARRTTGARIAVLASLPENMPESLAADLAAEGIAPLSGMDAGLAAIAALIPAAPRNPAPFLLTPAPAGAPLALPEDAAKAALAAHGLSVPASWAPDAVPRFPVALKALGLAHKTEAGAVALNLASPAALAAAAARMPPGHALIAEEMVTGALAELLVGVTRDPCGVMLLTLGAGGTTAEIMADTAHLILPTTPAEIGAALDRLRIAPLLAGFRGRPPADRGALVAAILAIAGFAAAHAARLVELDVNPLIARAADAVAVDALIRMVPE